jgi:hypothetical protein
MATLVIGARSLIGDETTRLAAAVWFHHPLPGDIAASAGAVARATDIFSHLGKSSHRPLSGSNQRALLEDKFRGSCTSSEAATPIDLLYYRNTHTGKTHI